MKTEQLYNSDTYLKEFDAKVIEVIPYEDKLGIVLDRTAFYPEGGGQPSDTGYLNTSSVLQVIEKNGELLHIINEPLQSKEVKGLLNWSKRFDHMQQHTGQHILSECFEKLYNGSTDSFHLGKDIASIEINIESFSEDDGFRIENMANNIIYGNLPVTARVVTNDELKNIPLRKMPQVNKNIRVVEIKNFDYSPCCGTHVSTTGEVGMIKIKSWEKCKGGIRFTFVCGYRALKDYSMQNSIIKALCEKLSVRDHDVFEAVCKVMSDCKYAEKQLSALNQELIKLEAEGIAEECPITGGMRLISRVFDNRNINDVKILAQFLTQMPGTVALLACRNESAQIIFSRSEDVSINMNTLFKAVIHIINGKGGGNAKTAQGGGSRVDTLGDFMDSAVNILKNEDV